MEYILSRILLVAMRNETHVEFTRDARDLVKRSGPGALGVTTQFAEYESVVNAEQALFEIITKSTLTPELEGLDVERHDDYHGLAATVAAALHHPEAEKRAAAVVIHAIIEHYGDISRKAYDDETANVDDILREFDTTANKAHIVTLGIAVWVAKLKSTNDAFVAKMHDRDTEAAQRPIASMKEARATTDKVLHTILARVEAMIILNGIDYTAALAPFVREWNVLVERYKHRLAIERGRRHAKKEKEEEGEESYE
jgi:hypothetical protein